MYFFGIHRNRLGVKPYIAHICSKIEKKGSKRRFEERQKSQDSLKKEKNRFPRSCTVCRTAIANVPPKS